MKKYAFGIDVGGTTCKIGFFETNGKLIDKWEIKTNTENNGAAILSDIAQAVDNKLAQEGIVEYKLRREMEKSEKSVEEAIAEAICLIKKEK